MRLSAIVSMAESGCHYLASESIQAKNQPHLAIKGPLDKNLVLAIAGKAMKTPTVHLPVSSNPRGVEWDRIVGDRQFMPPGYQEILYLPEIKQALGDKFNTLSADDARPVMSFEVTTMKSDARFQAWLQLRVIPRTGRHPLARPPR